MKILQISPCYVDLHVESGGVANIIREICLALEKNKIKTILICPNTELGKIVVKPGIVKYSEYLTVHILSQSTNPLLGPLRELKKLLKSIENINLAHIHTCFSVITEYSIRYFINQAIPTIFTPHGKLSHTLLQNKKLIKTTFLNFISIPSINKVDEMVCSSANEIVSADNLGITTKKSFIYNGYRINRPEIIKVQTHPNLKNYILFLGYLDPRKQPEIVIQAYALSRIRKIVKLVIAGPDSYNYSRKLKSIAKVLGLEINKDIIFTGRVSGNTKWELLKNAIALLLPSKGEGWPVVIAEAIGAGIPSIISRECNFSEIERLKIGIEVSDFDYKNWSEAIDRICTDEKLLQEFKQNLVELKHDFAWDVITQKWIDKYNAVINNSKLNKDE